mgnify:CR=1 FL=1
MIAAPAALAAVWSVNEVKSDWALTDCLSKEESKDSALYGVDPGANYYIKFDNATVVTDPVTGAQVLQETLTVKAPAGFRTFSTDTFRLRTTKCGHDFMVSLKASPTNSFGDPMTSGDWKDKGVKLYVSQSNSPGSDFSVAADWDQSPVVIDNGGAAVNAQTGDVLLKDDDTAVVGFELVGGFPALGTGTLNFQVIFTPIP